MTTQAAVILEDELSIPVGIQTLEAFRQWCRSKLFPERGRVDYLAGGIEVMMSPEDLYTHGTVKTTIAAVLHQLIAATELGSVFVDRTRISSPEAGLSVEPDVVVALDSSFEQGRLREVPAAGRAPGRFIELEGAPDLVVEIVSDGSKGKDTERLPPLYARAGIPELWLVDARGKELVFEVRCLDAGRYVTSATDELGWYFSSVLGRFVRLSRTLNQRSRWSYRLESRV